MTTFVRQLVLVLLVFSTSGVCERPHARSPLLFIETDLNLKKISKMIDGLELTISDQQHCIEIHNECTWETF